MFDPTAMRHRVDVVQSGPMTVTVTVIVMGVSGVGKSVVAAELVAATGWRFAEGDEFHSAANRAAMAAGHPLGDEDRLPWLRSLAGWIGEQEAAGRDAVLTCSALRRTYRDVLRDGHPSVRFAHLVTDAALVADRIGAREAHYMPPELLGSQLDTLEPLQPDEPGAVVDATGPPADVAGAVLARLGPPR